MIDDACAIHPFRPLACRHLNVFGARCGPDEDAFHTRRGDVLIPPREITDRAFAVMLPFYGITDRKAIEHAVRTRMLDSLARILQHCPWSELALRMQEFELKRS
jgi:Fe-S-cluster containining protein